MRSSSWLFLSSCLVLLTHCAHSNGPALASGPAPMAETGRGPVRGLAYEDGVAVFLGIPFAQPPTGERRWRAPEPAEPWSTPRDASRFGARCPQVDMHNGNKPVEAASEDCLTLNVWTPVERQQN